MTAAAHSDDLVTLSRDIIRKGSKSFAAAARLFDRETRASAYLLYAWCRHCDDVIDGQELGFNTPAAAHHDPHAALAELREKTHAALAGKTMSDPVFAAFQRVIELHAIPHRHPFELIDGFAMDVDERRYETIEDTLSYCYHVAGVVGVMMSCIMGAREEDTLDRASDLGIAFQLTNIVRDVVADQGIGRVYVPAAWLQEAGLFSETFAHPAHRKELFSVAQRMLTLADRYYLSCMSGISKLPLRSAWAIGTARAVYREIGNEVLRRGPHAWDQRVSTSKAQKLAAVTAGLNAAIMSRAGTSAPLSREGLYVRPGR